MPCTTILVGKKASYDGSTMIARNDDSGAGHYTSKKFVVIHPEEQPRAESARRTLFILFFLILKAPEKVSKDWAACWSSTVHTR